MNHRCILEFRYLTIKTGTTRSIWSKYKLEFFNTNWSYSYDLKIDFATYQRMRANRTSWAGTSRIWSFRLKCKGNWYNQWWYCLEGSEGFVCTHISDSGLATAAAADTSKEYVYENEAGGGPSPSRGMIHNLLQNCYQLLPCDSTQTMVSFIRAWDHHHPPYILKRMIL